MPIIGASPADVPRHSDLVLESVQRSPRLAEGLRNECVAPEHAFLALIALRKGAAYKILVRQRVQFDLLKSKIRESLPAGELHIPQHGIGRFSPEWQEVLLAAAMDAPRKGDGVGTGQLLWAILKHLDKGTSSRSLAKFLDSIELKVEKVAADRFYNSEPGKTYLGLITPDISKMRFEQETTWFRQYTYQVPGQKAPIRHSESKFKTGDARITLNELLSKWPSWTTEERDDFSFAYPNQEHHDQSILHFIVRQLLAGNYHPATPGKCALLFEILFFGLEYREETMKLLSDLVLSPGTYDFQADIILRVFSCWDGPRAIPVLERLLADYLATDPSLSLHATPSPKRVLCTKDVGACVGILYRLTENKRYGEMLHRLAKLHGTISDWHAQRALDEVAARYDGPLSFRDKTRNFFIRAGL